MPTSHEMLCKLHPDNILYGNFDSLCAVAVKDVYTRFMSQDSPLALRFRQKGCISIFVNRRDKSYGDKICSVTKGATRTQGEYLYVTGWRKLRIKETYNPWNTETLYLRLGKIKVIPVAGRGNPWRYETSRLRRCLNNLLTDGLKVVSSMRRPYLTPRNIPNAHFC
jgi:hypothetical protein